MPQSHPEAADLLASVRETLERDILPALTGDKQFNLRVSLNLIATVERELRLGTGIDEAAQARLAALLGRSRETPVAELNRDLAQRLRRGDFSLDDKALIDHLKLSVTDALKVNNPKWLGR